MNERKGTSFGQDICVVIGTVCVLQALKFAFGWQVATASAVTALIGCLVFLYHAGKDAA